jgi:hypothetical protein
MLNDMIWIFLDKSIEEPCILRGVWSNSRSVASKCVLCMLVRS